MRSGWLAALLILLVGLSACSGNPGSNAPSAGPAKSAALKIGVMPKLVGIPYFTATQLGAEQAAKELGVELDCDGPTTDSAEEQAKMVDRWIALEYDAIAVAPNDPEVIAPALRRAKEQGIPTLTWDADANPQSSGRVALVNQAPTEAIGNVLVDLMGEALGGKGKVVIITGSATSPNQNAWIKVMKARLAEKYPQMQLLETLVGDEDQNKSYRLTLDVLQAHDDLAGIWGITSVALPGAARAVDTSGRSGKVFVTGLSLPSLMRQYVHSGTVKQFVLWDAVDLGYLTVYAAERLCRGKLVPGEGLTFGRLKNVRVSPGEVLLGQPLVFDKSNVDRFQF